MNFMSQSWESLELELRPRLESVGFRPAKLPVAENHLIEEATFAAFESSYGILYCVWIASLDVQLITKATDIACDTMRKMLARAGANDWSRDGFVLVAIPASPNSDDLSSCLRAFEQGRTICRRHVIWPEPSGRESLACSWTERLDRVTLLSLPEAEAPGVPDVQQSFEPSFFENIHVKLKAGASYKLVADELVRAARERGDFHAS